MPAAARGSESWRVLPVDLDNVGGPGVPVSDLGVDGSQESRKGAVVADHIRGDQGFQMRDPVSQTVQALHPELDDAGNRVVWEGIFERLLPQDPLSGGDQLTRAVLSWKEGIPGAEGDVGDHVVMSDRDSVARVRRVAEVLVFLGSVVGG